ncbi:amino acid permease [Pectinatus brassicae]|uniref:AAT family amino acid transporter n=1 Tax=Pectinatus brassicae TaxID=862415 RepID=A0A840UF56_9FIRM|nr:amino acid permease [Pectinatus brassicae]MBB5335649.1 AAT family amino acid transporter [Pectinatus brassicae]
MDKFMMKRSLKNRHIQLISLGGIIGSGYFLGTGYILEKAGPAAILAYLLGGLIVFCVMLCLAELAVAKPISGSFVSYAGEYISPAWACGVGWAYWLNWIAYVPSEMIAAGIIMNNFVPMVSQVIWAIIFGLIITGINVFSVGKFGEMEFWLSLVKIIALIAFSFIAIGICLGFIGKGGYLGTSILLQNGGFAPHGYWSVFITMIIILVNFQGSEIIGLAAGECENPQKSIPIAVRNVSWRIIALYIIPVSLLISILPWSHAGLQESPFAAALAEYGFSNVAAVFAFVILTAAISCSNSGLYGSGRALQALAQMGMAPKWLGKINNHGMPQNSIFVSIVGCWLIILLYTYDKSSLAYTYLLAVSGFTGALAWISICWSQYNFRRKLQKENLVHTLKYKTPFFPYLTLFGIVIQILCLVVMAFTSDLRMALYTGIPMMVIPMVWYKITHREDVKEHKTVKLYH